MKIEVRKALLGNVAEGISKATCLIDVVQNQLENVYENNNGATLPVAMSVYQMAAMLELVQKQLMDHEQTVDEMLAAPAAA